MDNVVVKELRRYSITRVQILYGNKNKGYYGYRGDSMFFIVSHGVNYGLNRYMTQVKLLY